MLPGRSLHPSDEMHSEVALKVFDPPFRQSWRAEITVERPSARWETDGAPMDFLREIRLLSELQHPCVVELHCILWAGPSPSGGMGGEHGAWVPTMRFQLFRNLLARTSESLLGFATISRRAHFLYGFTGNASYCVMYM